MVERWGSMSQAMKSCGNGDPIASATCRAPVPCGASKLGVEVMMETGGQISLDVW